MLTHSCMFGGCLCGAKAELDSCCRDFMAHKAQNIYFLFFFFFLTEKVWWPKLYENGPKGHSLYQESVQSLFHFFTCFFIYFSIKNLLGSSLVSTIVLSTGVKRGKKFENYQKYRIKRKEGGCYRRKEHVKAWGDEIMIMTVPTL